MIVFENCSPVEIAVAKCSCVAGTALCNHNVALLFQTAHYSTLNLAAVPPVLNCTETEQRWHKPRTMGVKPGRVSDMVFISTKPKQFTVADGVRSTRYKAVRRELPDPDVLKVSEAYKDFSADIAPLITTMAISVDVPLVNSAFGKVQEGKYAMFEVRVRLKTWHNGFGREWRKLRQ
ncbi:Protein CASC3 [Dissostichus eleginoides]|uniref:Protein CASC3 n=1 Tax=Dissostichus eleginoides TaxID=100907 RepID=A0AAD9CDU3_DISEL|nr:Protein CASC3 [Dissostichus eleginoides]